MMQARARQNGRHSNLFAYLFQHALPLTTIRLFVISIISGGGGCIFRQWLLLLFAQTKAKFSEQRAQIKRIILVDTPQIGLVYPRVLIMARDDARILVSIVYELIAIVVELVVGIRCATRLLLVDAQYFVECFAIDLRQTWCWWWWRVAFLSPSLLKVRPRNDFSLGGGGGGGRRRRLGREKCVY